jgi:hypothetical protein
VWLPQQDLKLSHGNLLFVSNTTQILYLFLMPMRNDRAGREGKIKFIEKIVAMCVITGGRKTAHSGPKQDCGNWIIP